MKILLLICNLLLLTACGDSHRINDSKTEVHTEGTSAQCQLHFQTEDLCLKMSWDEMPTDSTFGSMTLTFTDVHHPSQVLSPRNEPFIVLWMPSMGHGSSPVTMTLVEEGVYKATDVFFIMPGPWEIRYQLKAGETVVEEVIQAINI